jgi:hypothetical protein
MKNNLSFYEKYYYTIIDNLFNNYMKDNDNILLIIDNEFNILENFSYIIKKKKLKVYLLVSNNVLYNKNMDYIKGKDKEVDINIFIDINEISNNIFKYIILFHLVSVDYFKDFLILFKNIINEISSIYIYCSLSKVNKLKYKNFIRETIMKYTSNKMGIVLSYNDIIESINDDKDYDIYSLKIYKNNNYIIYGYNTTYEIILQKK